MSVAVAPVAAPPGLRAVRFLGLPLQVGTPEEVRHWLVAGVHRRHGSPVRIVAHVNAANCFHLLRHPDLAADLSRRGRLLFDGVGMRIGADIVGLGQLPAVNGTDLFPLVMGDLAAARARVFLLGGGDGVARLAARRIRRAWPQVQLVGTHHGYFSPGEAPDVCRRVLRTDPDIVLVGLGFGRQERFALDHADCMDERVLWMVGGLFDFVSERVPRAPRWMREVGLEWLYRLCREPRRMFRRNFVSAPLFLLRCVGERLAGARRA